MAPRKRAEQIISAIGGRENLRACGICATRLRILVHDLSAVNLEGLSSIHGILGVFKKGIYGLELVLGPRLVTDVSNSIYEMTGIRSSADELAGFNTPSEGPAISVKVNDATAAETQEPAAEPAPPEDASDDEDAATIGELLQSIEEDDGDDGDELGEDDLGDEDILPRSLVVINGPNINMLGMREPSIYGTENYAQLVELCMQTAADAGFDSCECLQSNHEGDLVDYIQNAYSVHDAIVINPAAYTHTSIALLDALKAVQIPAVEVHISEVEAREDFRQTSYVRQACIATISGHGIEGYREAIKLLAQHLGI